MTDKYWVGIDDNWNDSSNWASSSGGAGGAGVPTSSDDVYFDGNGYVLCTANVPISINNLNLTSSMSELLIINDGGIIYGDFVEDAGYIANAGEEILDFQGNVTLNGGTFTTGSVGGEDDPTIQFSGAGKIITNNSGSNIQCSKLKITGTVTTAGSRLRTLLVTVEITDISGILTIASGNEVAISNGGTWAALTGTVTGEGNFEYEMDASAAMPISGVIDCEFELEQHENISLPARSWGGNFIIDVVADNLTLTLGAGQHYFEEEFEILADDVSVTTGWTLDCAANNAEFRCNGIWFVNSASFTQPSQFTMKWGDGIHIFYDELHLGLFGGNIDMVTECGDSTIILYTKKNKIYTYRMSRVQSTSHDTQNYNNIFLLRTRSDSATSLRFNEGFNCEKFRLEVFGPSNLQVRWANSGAFPSRTINTKKFILIGNDDNKPLIGWVKNSFGWYTKITVTEQSDVYGVTFINFRFVGAEWEVYNCDLSADDSESNNIIFRNREVRRIPPNRNILNNNYKIFPDPPPESVIEKMVDKLDP